MDNLSNYAAYKFIKYRIRRFIWGTTNVHVVIADNDNFYNGKQGTDKKLIRCLLQLHKLHCDETKFLQT
jgi:hypothetical protein